MAIFDTLKDYQVNRRILRELTALNSQLTRIADALDRAHPAPTTTAPTTIAVDDVNTELQVAAEACEQEYLTKYGRSPSIEEVYQWLEGRPEYAKLLR